MTSQELTQVYISFDPWFPLSATQGHNQTSGKAIILQNKYRNSKYYFIITQQGVLIIARPAAKISHLSHNEITKIFVCTKAC